MELRVVGVRVDENRICTPGLLQDPHECASHGHVDGPKDVWVEVRVSGARTGADYDRLVGLVGEVVWRSDD